jgi:hypothetical protein
MKYNTGMQKKYYKMISTKFINQLMDTFGVKQKDLAEEWTRLSDGGKQQSGVGIQRTSRCYEQGGVLKKPPSTNQSQTGGFNRLF